MGIYGQTLHFPEQHQGKIKGQVAAVPGRGEMVLAQIFIFVSERCSSSFVVPRIDVSLGGVNRNRSNYFKGLGSNLKPNCS